MKKGSLVVVGTGMTVGNLTVESQSYLTMAEKVFYLVGDATAERLILKFNKDAESLFPLYSETKDRMTTYLEIVDRVMTSVREGKNVCVAFYGHPGFFAFPSHKAIEIAREEGFSAKMLPGISCVDALFCDLGIDAGVGCQILEATDLLLRKRALDVYTHVIILQVSCLGDRGWDPRGYGFRKLPRVMPTLVEYIKQFYGDDHEVKAYHASNFSLCDPLIETIKVGELTHERISWVSTLYIPPLTGGIFHLEMIDKLEMRDSLDGFTLVPLNSVPPGSRQG
jgi:uncharacterized protein YabN with tetrapyrrole methylase and pyrophosphatase domain